MILNGKLFPFFCFASLPFLWVPPHKIGNAFQDGQADPIPRSTQPQQGTNYKLPTYDSYHAPFCPGAPCGKCYTITNKANQKKITVQIIDACPANTAWNYCKAPGVDPDQRCADPDTNQVDIDESAYPALSNGQSYSSVSRFPFRFLIETFRWQMLTKIMHIGFDAQSPDFDRR
ncbi:MAG: hypothetical protein Q9219_005039 [cf. Caloplaca sp. 3 TL-2023]